MEVSDLLTVKETAEALRCSERSVYRYIEAKLLVAKKIAGKTLVPASSLQTFIDGQEDAG